MKRFFQTVLAGIALCILNGCSRSATTPPETAAMFQKAGGIEKVNAEARAIFQRFGTGEFKMLKESDLKAFPAISSLGSAVGIYPKDSGSPAYISVRFGSENNAKFIFIYDASGGSEIRHSSSTIQVSANIFVSS